MSKYIHVLFFLILSATSCFSQNICSYVDERFELTSIVCRLAGYKEYMHCRIDGYAKNIDQYFAAYKKHPLIDFMHDMRENRGLSYGDIPEAAVAIDIDNEHIRFNPEYQFIDIADSTSRWTPQILARYISLLDDFYRQSKFHDFFSHNRYFYSRAEFSLNKILNLIDAKWFERFFGQSLGTPQIYISMTNGSSHYALTKIKGNFGILMGCDTDSNGNPCFNERQINTIVHELSHNFCNPLSSAYSSRVYNIMSGIASYVEKSLNKAAYTSRDILPEWLTRLSVLMYLKEHDPGKVPIQIAIDRMQGFIWQDRAYAFMENFYRNRIQYEYFSDYIPQLIGFLDFVAGDIKKVVNEYENRNPYVVNVFPAIGTQLDLSQKVVEFRITFSEPMATNSDGYQLQGNNLNALTTCDIPADWKISEWIDNFTYVIRLKSEWIKVCNITGFSLSEQFMQSQKNYGLSENFSVTYNTAEL